MGPIRDVIGPAAAWSVLHNLEAMLYPLVVAWYGPLSRVKLVFREDSLRL